MVTMTSAYTDEEITEATRLLLEMRDNCIRKDTDKYDDPLRKYKYNALNMAIDGLQYLPTVEKGE
jgi:hypothetical protein